MIRERRASGEGSSIISPGPTATVESFGPTDRYRGWIVTAVIGALAAITRLTLLNYPTDAGTPVFDEKHYVIQAYQLLGNGWLEDNPGYGLVVHPPVGKQMIAIGELLLGYNAWGWRIIAALSGVAIVVLVTRIVRRMTRSTLIGAIAGLLAVFESVLFVSSRVGMLDIFQALFVVGAFGCLIVDRDQVRERMAAAAARGTIGISDYGPRLGVRWWRFGAGVLLGLALGTKWSGLYYIAVFGLMSVAFDVAARRAYGVRKPWKGTAIRDIGPALYALTGIPVGVYLLSYLPWFASETGVYRHVVGNQVPEGGPFGWVPDGLRALVYYSAQSLKFHEGLTNSAGNHHPWESKPFAWPMSLRPLLYYYVDSENVSGCRAESCVKAILLVGVPAMWWLSLPMLGWLTWMAIVRRDWRYGTVLAAYGAGIVPWFASLDRQMYFFYMVPAAPFMVMGFALVLASVLGPADASVERRRTGLLVICLYLAVVIANFVWLWPILTGLPISTGMWQQELWLPSWR